MGPYNHANATIGRAYNLASLNLQGGSVPGDTYMGTLGNWYNYSSTFAEAEERSPWAPLHVQKGFKPTDSTASVFFGGWYTHAGYGPRATWKEKIRHCLRRRSTTSRRSSCSIRSSRGCSSNLGYDTKEKLIDWCAENSTLPAREYWDNQWVQTLIHPLAVAGVEPFASRLKANPDELVRAFEPSDIHIVVAGGETQGAWKMFAGSYRPNMTISIDAWR